MGTTGGDREKLLDVVKGSNAYAVIAPQMGKQIVAFQVRLLCRVQFNHVFFFFIEFLSFFFSPYSSNIFILLLLLHLYRFLFPKNRR
jgi:hypothetical protein